jgi:hypothetical protein
VLLNVHYFGLVVFTSQLIVFIIHALILKENWRFILPALIAGILAGLSLLHWLPVILHDLQITSFHIKPITVRYLLKFLWWYFYDPAAFIIFLGLSFFFIKKLYIKLREHSFSTNELVLTSWLALGFTIPLIYSLIKFPLLTNKYCTIQMPAVLIFISQGFVLLRSSRLKTYIVSILLVSAFTVLFIARPPYKKSFHEDGREFAMMYFNAEDSDIRSWNEDWREVATFFKSQDTTNQVIFSQLAWFHEYYFKKFNIKSPVDQNVCNFAERIKNSNRIWLLLHAHYVNSTPYKKFSPDQETMLKNFALVDSVSFIKSKAFLYAKIE